MKRFLLISSVIALSAAISISVYHNVSNTSAVKSLDRFSGMVRSGQLEDVRLSIYYMSPTIFTLVPMDVDGLIRGYDYHAVIDSDGLLENIEYLKMFNNTTIMPVNEGYVNARLYYIFETSNGSKIFDVVMRSPFDNVFINGKEFVMNGVFFDAIVPFLPEAIVNQWEQLKHHGLYGVIQENIP